jgi:uncharacterized membrane protein YGL010W
MLTTGVLAASNGRNLLGASIALVIFLPAAAFLWFRGSSGVEKVDAVVKTAYGVRFPGWYKRLSVVLGRAMAAILALVAFVTFLVYLARAVV